jgi:hypothetical protein
MHARTGNENCEADSAPVRGVGVALATRPLRVPAYLSPHPHSPSTYAADPSLSQPSS